MVRESATAFWLKTENTVLHYQSDKVAPETIVTQTSLRILEGSSVNIECYGRQRNTPKTKTISLLFSWQVNDGPWTNFQPVASEGIVVSGLRPGKHTVQIRARDGDGDVDSSPAVVRIEVFPVSVFDTIGFKVFMGSVFVLVLYLAIYALKARRNLKIYAQNLESIIEQRTVDFRESEKKYRELVQNANSMILRLTHDGNILFINEFAQSFFGYTHEEIHGQSILNTLVPKRESAEGDFETHLHAILTSPTAYPAQEERMHGLSGHSKQWNRTTKPRMRCYALVLM